MLLFFFLGEEKNIDLLSVQEKIIIKKKNLFFITYEIF